MFVFCIVMNIYCVAGCYVHSWWLWRPDSSARRSELRSFERGGVSAGWRCFCSRARPIRTHAARRRCSVQPPWRHQPTHEGWSASYNASSQNRNDAVQVRFHHVHYQMCHIKSMWLQRNADEQDINVTCVNKFQIRIIYSFSKGKK